MASTLLLCTSQVNGLPTSLCDTDVKNTRWFGNVFILIYSPLKFICVVNFLESTDSAYSVTCSCLPFTQRYIYDLRNPERSFFKALFVHLNKRDCLKIVLEFGAPQPHGALLLRVLRVPINLPLYGIHVVMDIFLLQFLGFNQLRD